MAKLATNLMVMAIWLILPVSVFATPRNIHVEWDFQYSGSIAGFRLYHEDTVACQTTDPNATSMDCVIDAPDGETFFTLKAFLQDGTEGETSQPYSYIFSSSLKANLTADLQQGESPLAVSFDAATSTGNVILYDWMFGDGETGTGSIVSHTYVAGGNYTSTLKITDTIGATDRETVSIVVTEPQANNDPPSATISSSSSVGPAPLSIEFDGTASTDNDGNIISYDWDFGDGGSGTGATAIHTYNTAGTYNAKLTVTDNGGLTDSISTPVLVSEPTGEKNTLPVAIITTSVQQGYTPLTVSFNGENSSDPDGEIKNYTWNFGDGSTATGESVKHTYTEPAVFTVTLKVTDNMGASSNLAKRSITVLDSATKHVPLPKKILRVLTGVYHLLLKKVISTDTEPEQQE